MEMCDQIIEHCTSDELRQKLLEENGLNLSGIIEEAKRFELVTQQADMLCKNGKETVNKITKYEDKKYYKTEKSKTENKACYRCGNENHFKNDPSCPAKDKKCGQCGLIGHFKTDGYFKDKKASATSLHLVNDERGLKGKRASPSKCFVFY
ncbi:hypothetical protein ACI65C_009737 [Semiaphis heraclei]